MLFLLLVKYCLRHETICAVLSPPPPPRGPLHPFFTWILSPCLCESYDVTAPAGRRHHRTSHPHTHTHANPQHQTHIPYFFFLEDMAVFSQTMSPPPRPPPEPLTWLTALVFGIKCEADECVCGANYDIALRCQNILRTEFLHAGPRG